MTQGITEVKKTLTGPTVSFDFARMFWERKAKYKFKVAIIGMTGFSRSLKRKLRKSQLKGKEKQEADLHNDRLRLKWDSRYTMLTYGMLCGKKYLQIESKCNCAPSPHVMLDTFKDYGISNGYHLEYDLSFIKNWLGQQ